MAVFLRQMKLLCLVILFACQGGKGKQPLKTVRNYKDTPAFIKSFLDTKYEGKFFIAEPGQKWNSGCLSSADVPRYQFSRAYLDSIEYRMEFWAGGIAGPHLDTVVLGIHNNEVISYSLKSYQYKVK